jgi:hypothetical protein
MLHLCLILRSKKKRKSTQSVVIDASEVELAATYGDIGGNRNLISEIEYIGGGLANSNGLISTNAHLDPDAFFQVNQSHLTLYYRAVRIHVKRAVCRGKIR